MKNKDNLNNIGVNGEQEKKDRKLDNLINIVENHTRTERHLEQYSDISSPENKERAIEKQIDELKGQIIGEKQNENKQEYELEDLKENYKIGIDYYENVDKD